MVPLAHPSPQRYGITVQTWRIFISYRHVCTDYNNALFGTMTSHYTAQ